MANPNFSLQGEWSLSQSNGFIVDMTVFQTPDGLLSGSATARNKDNEAVGSGDLEQGISVVDRDAVFFIIDWKGGSRGRYEGVRNPFDHRLSGTSTDLKHPTNVAAWATSRTFG